jgi:hypothetical protein
MEQYDVVESIDHAHHIPALTENPVTYPPPNPYDPNQSPGYGQPSQQPYGQPSQQPYDQPSQPGYGVPSQPGGGFSAPPQQPGFPPQAGLPPQPGFPPTPEGPYGAPLPPPMPPASGSGGLIAKILSVVGVLAVGLVIVVVRALNNDSTSDTTTTADETAAEPTTEAAVETAIPEEEGAVVNPAAVGDCMSDAAEGTSTDLVVPCDDPTAFWTVTKVSDDSGATHSPLGGLDDPSIADSVCGHEHMVWTPGEIWRSYQYVYTESFEGLGGPVDYLYCVEAIDKEDADGGRPVTPDTGSCTDDSLRTFDCTNPLALYVVDDVETYDPPVDELSFDSMTAVGGCPNSEYYASPVTGGDGLVYLAYCRSDNA